MKTRIVAAFPGMGKTHLTKRNPESCLELGVSVYKPIKDDNGNVIKTNPDFPKNIIEDILKNIGNYEFIFVGTDQQILDALVENCLFFYLIYPYETQKIEYFEKYQNRGSSNRFKDLMERNWYDYILNLDYFVHTKFGFKYEQSHQNLSDVLERINIEENETLIFKTQF